MPVYYAERYTECYYAECRSAERRGTFSKKPKNLNPQNQVVFPLNLLQFFVVFEAETLFMFILL
jgi:hypothetical protein